jgi:Zn-dependent protease with chaperone function
MNALPYLLHGTTLALAWLLLFNIVTTACVAAASALLTRRSNAGSPGFWLALRLSPAALSIAFVAFVFLPSYWRYEPREFVEGFDVSLTALAALAVAVVGGAVARGVTAWRRVQRRTQDWLRAGRPLALADTSMPAYAIDTDAPVMALVGVLRPRLLITRPVLEALTDEELRAGVAHELGHRRAWDNLKRLAMRAAPDLLFATGVARTLERRWAAAAERVADRGAGDSGRARCALASALVKVARLTPPVNSVAEPISALVDGGDIATRVQRLLDDTPTAATPRAARWLGLAIPAAALALYYAPLLRMVHAVTEILVNSLP